MTQGPAETVDQRLLQMKAGIAADVQAGLFTAGAIMIGDRVGLYRAMAAAGPLTSHELAERADLNERFVREWLHQQTAAQIIEYRGEERFELTHEAALIFADTDNPMSQVGMFARLPGWTSRFELAVDAFRTGVGATYSDGADTEGLIRNPLQIWSRTALVPSWLAGPSPEDRHPRPPATLITGVAPHPAKPHGAGDRVASRWLPAGVTVR